jgi:hypothetical protein
LSEVRAIQTSSGCAAACCFVDEHFNCEAGHLDSFAQHRAPGISSLRFVVLGAAGMGVCTMVIYDLPSNGFYTLKKM